jgi:SAM-dependent methyltransferase
MTAGKDQRTVEYYARRVSEYERVYAKPERQFDLRQLEEFLTTVLARHDVLEVACGTGYWTQFIAKTARSIVATDINAEALEFAREKDYGACQVRLVKADAYSSLCSETLRFTAGFHGFWWSHIPIERIDAFLGCFHSVLPVGAPVVMIDNAFVEGSSTPIGRRDENGNTYQTRRLQDGSSHKILKNFPTIT